MGNASAAWWSSLFSRKPLPAFVGVLFVPVVLLLFTGQEAQAQEQVEGQYSSVTIEVTTPESWVGEWQMPDEMISIEFPEVEPIPVADQYDPGASTEPEPTPEPEQAPASVPEPVPTPETPVEDQHGPGAGAEPVPTPEPTPEPVPAPAPEPVPAPAPEPTPEPAPEPLPAPESAPETPVEEQYGPAPVPEPAPAPVPEPAPEPAPTPQPAPAPESEPAPEPTPEVAPVPEKPLEDQYDPGTGGAAPPMAEAPPEGQTLAEELPVEEPPAPQGPAPAQEPVSEPAPEPTEPVAPGEDSAYPSLHAQGSQPPPSVPEPEAGEDGSLPSWTSSLQATVSDATETLSGVVAGAFEALTDPPDSGATDGGFWGPVGAALTDWFFGGQPDRSPLDDARGGDAAPASGSQSPSEDAPQPFHAGLLPTGASQASSPGGGTSTGGGVPLLLVCVLASVALLARWEGWLSWLHFLLPRPYSAPRRALERPG